MHVIMKFDDCTGTCMVFPVFLSFESSTMAAGGYEHDFLEQSSVLKEFECPLCLRVTREPNLISCCGQHFCQNCINQITANRKPCPFCKEKCFTVMLDKKQRRKVLELKVSCTMKERGCASTGKLEDLAAHTNSDVQNSRGCQYVKVICSNKCGKSLQRRYLHTHLSDHCPNRRFMCIYCNYEDTYVNIQDKHYPKCPKYPIPCPNECDIVKVQRCLMTKHLNECPKEFVECEFAHAGCDKFRREDLEKHAEQRVQSHLSMVSSKLLELGKEMKTKLDEKDQEVRALKTRLDMKDEEVRALKTRLDMNDEEMRALKTRLVMKDEEMRALKTKDKAVRALKTRLDMNDEEMRALKTRLVMKDEEMRALKPKDKAVRALKTRLDMTDEEMRALKTRLDMNDKKMNQCTPDRLADPYGLAHSLSPYSSTFPTYPTRTPAYSTQTLFNPIDSTSAATRQLSYRPLPPLPSFGSSLNSDIY